MDVMELYTQRPLRYDELQDGEYVWIEEKDFAAYEPVRIERATNSVFEYWMIGEEETARFEPDEYNGTWRAWYNRPTTRDKKESKWL